MVFPVRLFLLISLLSVTPLSGCNNSSSRIPLTGDVLVDGVRITGEISLRPVESGSGGITTTEIKDGAYQFTETNGPLPASYTVLIEETATGGKGATAAPVEARKWSIPRTLSADQDRWDFIVDSEQTTVGEEVE